MWKEDILKLKELHKKYDLEGPLLDAGGQYNPTIADYDFSIRKALKITVKGESGNTRIITVPHEEQKDRYLQLEKPWKFVDEDYTILNPEYGDPYIEDLPEKYENAFNTVVMVSVFEHVNNPYIVSDALFKIIKPGGYLFNSTPFLFPLHPSPEDNWRFAPTALQRIHENSGFEWVEGDFHININSNQGVGDYHDSTAPQAIMASYALCRKPL